MGTEFKAVTPERAVQIMRAWAHHSWPMTVQDGIDVCTSLGSTVAPRDPASFASDMRDRLLGSGALPLFSSVPGARLVCAACRAVQRRCPQPVRTACRAARHSAQGARPVRAACRAAQGLRPEGRPRAR